MDEAVVKYYRQLLRQGFQYFGAIDNASIFVESYGDRFSICGIGGGFMELYAVVAGEIIVEIKYRCSCEPVANVAVEVLCGLVKGMSLAEVARLSETTIGDLLGARSEELDKKSRGLLALLAEGIAQYQCTDNQ